MRAALMERGTIRVETVDDPVPRKGEILVKSLVCGICGSDLHATRHTEEFVRTSREAGGAFKLTTFDPVVLGHEFCAEVIDYGPDTERTWATGSLVCPYATPGFHDADDHVVFECVGVPGMLDDIFLRTMVGSRIVVVGVCLESDHSRPLIAINKELNVQYVLGYSKDEFDTTLRMIAEGTLEVEPMVTHSVALDGVADAFANLARPDTLGKVVVKPWD